MNENGRRDVSSVEVRRRMTEPANAVAARDVDVARVRAALFLFGLRGDDIDDVVQDVRLRLLERPPTGVASPDAYACAVALNLARDRHRRSQRWRGVHLRLVAATPTAYDDPDVALKQAVADGLARLDPDLREALVLRYFADLTVPQLAQVTGVPEGTVKSRLHRAITAMRDLLPPEG